MIKTKKCSNCEEIIETCDDCGDKFSIGDAIKHTDILGHKHICESCFNDRFEDAEVELK
ncbi:MAG: hypothetical protein AABY22_01555 [Nanoarchaeota archaeon]